MKYEPDAILVRYEEKPVWAYKQHISRFENIFPQFHEELRRRYYNTLEGRIQRHFEEKFLVRHTTNLKMPLPITSGATIKFHRYNEAQ